MFRAIAPIEALDPHRLTFTLKEPFDSRGRPVSA